MRWASVCEGEEIELGRQQASGECPNCGGKVEAIDVERLFWFCFLPLCSNIKRRFFCSFCFKRLELNQ